MRKWWTVKEENLLRQMYKTNTKSQCAESLGRTLIAIHTKLRDLGLLDPSNTGGSEKVFYAEDIANMMELKTQGATWAQISGNYPDSTIPSLHSAISKAKRFGFDRYPLRGSA